jgi:hypothetical protein
MHSSCCASMRRAAVVSSPGAAVGSDTFGATNPHSYLRPDSKSPLTIIDAPPRAGAEDRSAEIHTDVNV